jgi:hypothetical protein
MTNDRRAALKYDYPDNENSDWISMLRRTNTQIQTGLASAPNAAMLRFRDANTLALLKNLMPNMNPELLRHVMVEP